MRAALLPGLLFVALACPAAAQEAPGSDVGLYSPGELGVVATSPSRMDRSRLEMNHDRNTPWAVSMSPAQTRGRAEQAIARAGLICSIADAVVVGRVREGEPLIEVDCAQGGGLIVANADPVMAVDCLDLAPDQGQAGGRNRRVVAGCLLPGNVAAVAAASRQSAPVDARN